jgi:hypothetical protein
MVELQEVNGQEPRTEGSHMPRAFGRRSFGLTVERSS